MEKADFLQMARVNCIARERLLWQHFAVCERFCLFCDKIWQEKLKTAQIKTNILFDFTYFNVLE